MQARRLSRTCDLLSIERAAVRTVDLYISLASSKTNNTPPFSPPLLPRMLKLPWFFPQHPRGNTPVSRPDPGAGPALPGYRRREAPSGARQGMEIAVFPGGKPNKRVQLLVGWETVREEEGELSRMKHVYCFAAPRVASASYRGLICFTALCDFGAFRSSFGAFRSSTGS